MATGKRMAIATCAFGWVLAGLWGAFLAGCDVPPGVPRTADGRQVKSVVVDPNDAEEVAGVRYLLVAASRYEQALKGLQAFYIRTGAYDQQVWAARELKNFTEAQPWKYEGVEGPPAPTGTPVGADKEATLVEGVVSARQDWKNALVKLDDLYKRKGMHFKLALIRNVQQRFDPIRTYMYFLHAEVPPATLRPSEEIPKATDLFDLALRLHREGKPLPAVTDYKKQRQALLLFRQLVDQYPTSTKIAQAAYYIGEIYKEYFNEDLRAVQWYKRAWEWDPNITLPARFQAATVHDVRLAHYGEALKLYQEVIKHEQFNQSNVGFAKRRIKQLTQPE